MRLKVNITQFFMPGNGYQKLDILSNFLAVCYDMNRLKVELRHPEKYCLKLPPKPSPKKPVEVADTSEQPKRATKNDPVVTVNINIRIECIGRNDC